MNLDRTLKVVNDMQANGVIGEYAIGGAVAAFLYIEPGTTFDLDIFIGWEPGPSGLLTLGPLYTYLFGRGYKPEREAIMIEGWAVQFLPPGTELVKEALVEAQPLEISGVPTRVFTQEHLMAVSLQTGRPKDFARLVQFVQEGHPIEARLMDILTRHGLEKKWHAFQTRFFEPL